MSSSSASPPVVSSPVVSTQWLADHLGSDTLVILDATVVPKSPETMSDVASSESAPAGAAALNYVSGLSDYLTKGHIPAALFADLIKDFSDPTSTLDFARPGATQFEAAAANLGIDNSTTVIIYDASIGQWAARLWWLFRAFGYDDVAVLDGGLVKWHAETRPFATGGARPRPGRSFSAAPRPNLWVDKSFVESVVVGDAHAALVCSLSPAEFSGQSESFSRAGHIPGSINIPAATLIDRHSNAFVRGDQLEAALAPAAGAAPHLVTYCGGGIAAAVSALALTLAGNTNVSIYDGSLQEWTADADAPLHVSLSSATTIP